MTTTSDGFEVRLDWNEANHLLTLVEREISRVEKSIRKARRHPDQTEGDFVEYVDRLREKLVWLKQLADRLEEDELDA